MNHINLIGGREAGAPDMRSRQRGGVREVVSTAVAAAALVVAGTLAVSEALSIRRTTQAVSAALETAAAERREQAATEETLADAVERRAALSRRVAQLARWERSRAAPSRLLDVVSRSMPDGLWLTDFRQEADALVLVGHATDAEPVFGFASNLESSGRLALPVDVAGIDTAGAGRFEIRVVASASEEW